MERLYPTVKVALPPASFFQFPPDPHPAPLSPLHISDTVWWQPFNIPPGLYTSLLSVKVPVSIAVLYATTAMLMNRINKNRANQPWAFSKTRTFAVLVVVHNVFLAVYSLWTFLGMTRAFWRSWPDMPRVGEGQTTVTIVDSLCHIQGPRGLGNAALFDFNSESWKMPNPSYKLAESNVPDSTDVGRLWNEGLAYFGWLFYLSKFYEVLDTAIILAKGKRSSTLQTYHHAGAMMCMWAGIRFMASPIWVFALFNSAIHAMMYTYYTLTALSIRVPVRVKRTLTTMQILQFIIGCLLAASHLFIHYSIPVSIPYDPSPLEGIVRAVSSPGSQDDVHTAGGMGSWIKKLALRAAGVERLTEFQPGPNGTLFNSMAAASRGRGHLRYTRELRTVTCMDTSGQAFAVYLNVIYLLPLTYLFVRFFVRSYLARSSGECSAGGKQHTGVSSASCSILTAEKAGMDAIKGVTMEITNAVIDMHGDSNAEEANEDEGGNGTETPHPEAYEANIEDVMSEEQKYVAVHPDDLTSPTVKKGRR